MKNIRLLVTIATLALPSAGAVERAWAFHSGGVAECEGCHTMHNSYEGRSMSLNAIPAGATNRYLMLGSDASSTCLNCHEQTGDSGPNSHHVSTPGSELPTGQPPKQLSPGGDFGWLKKSYNWTSASGQPVSYSYGERHGHNIVSSDYGYFQDGTKSSAPGGSYPSSSLSCISCHDPHGKYRRSQSGSITTSGLPVRDSGSLVGSPDPSATSAVGVYRMLGGVGYKPKSVTGSYEFVYPPPTAVAPDTYNRSESATQTRVAYGTGMSNWCRNCHANIHTDSSGFKHPAGDSSAALRRSDISIYYNSYVKDGTVSGVQATSFLSLVPFETGDTSYATLKNIVTTTPTMGPNTSSDAAVVMCLSCHRAHASGWDNILRWNNKTSKIVHSGSYAQEGYAYQPYGQGRATLEAQKANYDIPASSFASEQNPLCYKCHQTGTK
jgi:cytochrome c553